MWCPRWLPPAGLWGLSLSGKDLWPGTQEAGFKSRSITTCSETLGKSFSLSCLPFLVCTVCTHRSRSGWEDSAGWDSSGCPAYRRLSLVGAAISKPACSSSSGLFTKPLGFTPRVTKPLTSSDAVLPEPSFSYCLRQPELMLCPWPASVHAGSQVAGH